jgi:hypothetical protein
MYNFREKRDRKSPLLTISNNSDTITRREKLITSEPNVNSFVLGFIQLVVSHLPTIAPDSPVFTTRNGSFHILNNQYIKSAYRHFLLVLCSLPEFCCSVVQAVTPYKFNHHRFWSQPRFIRQL